MTRHPLPALPDTLTLAEARAVVAAFGWKLTIEPADPSTPGPGFAPNPKEDA